MVINVNVEDNGLTDTKNLVNKLQKANYLNEILLNAIPHPALLIRKDRKVIAANKIAREAGTIIGGYCWRDWGACQYINAEDKARMSTYNVGTDKPICCFFCKGDVALRKNGAINIKEKLGEIFWDIFWVPTQEKDVYLHYAIDITEQIKTQEEIARLDRLNLIGQIAAGIGHEIRNPMTVVRGYLQLMGSKSEFQSQNTRIETMINALDQANSIITEFLLLARNKPTEMEIQNINKILLKLYPLLRADAFTQNKQLVIETGETPDILLDSKEISQLVLNLCRNGLEAMSEGGMLTMRTFVQDQQVILSVQDQGSGIPAEYLDKLGTPFFTTKDFGTGLGLATSYCIAERHNAKIKVETGTKGTIFFIQFNVPLRQTLQIG